MLEAGKILDWASSRARCGCTFSAAGNIFDPTLAPYSQFVFPSYPEPLQPPPASSYLLDPCCPSQIQPHLMLMKLPEDMCTCSARISRSFTPAARLRGLEVGSRQRKESGDPLGHFGETTSRGAEQPSPLSTSHLDFCSLLPARQASPTPKGPGGCPRLEPLLLVSDNVAIFLC